MYELITLQTHAKQRGLMHNQQLKKVINFILANNNVVTLREIKRGISDIDCLEQQMEQWVELGVISRYHGRYEVNGTVLSNEQQSRVFTNYRSFFNQFIDKNVSELTNLKLDMDQFSFYILSAFAATSLYKQTDYYILEMKKDSPLQCLPLYFQKLHGKKTNWLSFESFDSLSQCSSLATYFYDVNNRVNIKSKKYLVLEKLLGDVNVSYFLMYSERKLRRIAKGRSITSEQPDIFLEALHDLGYLKIENHDYQMTGCVIQQEIATVFDHFINKLIETFENDFMIKFDFCEMICFLYVLKHQQLLTDNNVLFGFETL